MRERDVEYDADLDRFAQAAAEIKISFDRIEQMWARIRIILDDMQKIDHLLDDVFGPDARMVDE